LWIWWVLNRFEAEDGSAGWAFKQNVPHGWRAEPE
jgi:hypothetical protein